MMQEFFTMMGEMLAFAFQSAITWIVLLVFGVFILAQGELREPIILFLYGGIGFFGAIAFLYFFGGYTLYLVRMGQEYRQEGLYHMLNGVRILIYVLFATILLYFLE